MGIFGTTRLVAPNLTDVATGPDPRLWATLPGPWSFPLASKPPHNPSTPSDDAPTSSGGLNFTAALVAWVCPGWGHWVLGYTGRAILLFVTITSIWIVGLAVGGVTVIDSREGRLFFLMGQVGVGPAVVVDRHRQSLVDREPAPDPEQNPSYAPAYARSATLGTIYTTVAGMLNLLAVLDVAHRPPKPASAPAKPTGPQPGPDPRPQPTPSRAASAPPDDDPPTSNANRANGETSQADPEGDA